MRSYSARQKRSHSLRSRPPWARSCATTKGSRCSYCRNLDTLVIIVIATAAARGLRSKSPRVKPMVMGSVPGGNVDDHVMPDMGGDEPALFALLSAWLEAERAVGGLLPLPTAPLLALDTAGWSAAALGDVLPADSGVDGREEPKRCIRSNPVSSLAPAAAGVSSDAESRAAVVPVGDEAAVTGVVSVGAVPSCAGPTSMSAIWHITSGKAMASPVSCSQRFFVMS
mmetsp:Transcript_16521/g.51270  ORF Transcript_16521/g.51270 Transcript_16521/m.51270 type:complete len:226 (-) Transcript_16521:290-967(-)